MAHANPIVEALMDDLAGRLGDVDAVQRNVDAVRAEIAEYAALHAEAAAQLEQAHRRLVEVAFRAAARRSLDDPEVAAHVAAYVEAAGRVELVRQNVHLRVEALAFLAASRALAFAFNRAHLLPGVLVTAAAAYAMAYVVSSGTVVPGPTSILRIAVLVLCLLLGIPVVGNLP